MTAFFDKGRRPGVKDKGNLIDKREQNAILKKLCHIMRTHCSRPITRKSNTFDDSAETTKDKKKKVSKLQTPLKRH